MGQLHYLKIEPGSEAETYFMELTKEVGVKPNSLICRLGSEFGTNYNEFIISDGLYKAIQQHILQKKGLA